MYALCIWRCVYISICDDFTDASCMSPPSYNKEPHYNRECREGNSTSLSANNTPPNSAQYTNQGMCDSMLTLNCMY